MLLRKAVLLKSAIDKSLSRLNDIIAIKCPGLKCRVKTLSSRKSDEKFERIGLKILFKRTENDKNIL